MSGYQYPEWMGKLHFWAFFIGVNLTFFPQHFLGLQGMPRRYLDYNDAYAKWHEVSSIGSYISFGATIFFLITVLVTFIRREKVGNNPWGEGATTLEWTVPSPPAFHTFDELPPVPADSGHGKH
jgi:cytochrome c oxidase subunit 1